MRLHRLIAILLLIESRGCIKAGELAEALETSKRTIHRDIDILCEAGIPITATAGPAGGFSLIDGYQVNLKELHCDEVISLYLCGMGLYPQDYSEASLNLKNAILKLEKTVPRKYLADIQTARERFYFDPGAWWQVKPDLRFLDVLRRALWHSKKVNLTYANASKGNHDVKTRIIRPYGLIVKNGEWYLVAYCELKQEIRVFKCERIIQADMRDDSFRIPSDFNLETFWRGSVNQFKVDLSKTPCYPVKLRVISKTADCLANFEILDPADDRDRDDSIRTINLYSFENACQEMIRLNHRVEILAPFELREFVIENAKRVLSVYS